MVSPVRRREMPRGERTVPGIYRLRLPLPFPGVPHCNAWAVSADDGVVLFDCGMHENGSMGELEMALAQVGLCVEDIRLLVCTHAHVDHYGQAAPLMERSGCELWMHPAIDHAVEPERDVETFVARRVEIARACGVPDEPLRRWAADRLGAPSGIAKPVQPHRRLTEGMTVDTDLGSWTVVETPGHAPSHICLYNPALRALISGDHLTGRVALFFEFGWSPDPVGEFLSSLDRVVEIDAHLALSGHGKPFVDVAHKVAVNRELVRRRLERVAAAVAREARPAFALRSEVLDGDPRAQSTAWLVETLAYLNHLERTGRVSRLGGGQTGPDLWAIA